MEQEKENFESVSKPKNIVEKANEAAERIEAANAEQKRLVEEQLKIAAMNRLSGQSEAGIVKKEPTKEEAVQERVNKMLEGTGFKI